MRFHRWHVLGLGLALVVFGCGDPNGETSPPDSPLPDAANADASGDLGETPCEAIVGDFCGPPTPQGTPADQCPSEQRAELEWFENGICQPAAPDMNHTEWLTPSVSQDFGADCDLDTLPGLGDTSCVPFPSCPSEGFAADNEIRAAAGERDGQIVFVDGSAESGGNGSRGAPYSQLSDALSGLQAGDIVAARSSLSGPTTVPNGVAVVGTCTSGSNISGGGAETPSVTLGEDTLLANFTITSQGGGVLVDGIDGEVNINDVLVDSPVGWGVQVLSGSLTIESSRIVGVGAASSSRPGYGVEQRGGSVEASHLVIEDVAAGAYRISGEASELSAEDLLILNPSAVDFGLLARQGAVVSIDRAIISGGFQVAILVTDDSSVSAENLQARGNESAGEGAVFEDESSGTLRRTSFTGHTSAAVTVLDDASLSFENLATADMRLNAAASPAGRGLFVDGGSATGSYLTVENSLQNAIAVFGGSLDATAVRVLAVERPSDLSYGAALFAVDGAIVELSELTVEDSFNAGLVAYSTTEAVSEITVNDCEIDGVTGIVGDEVPAQAVTALPGGSIELTRCEVRNVGDLSVIAQDPGAHIGLTDVLIDAPLREDGDAVSGRAIDNSGGHISLERVQVTNWGLIGVRSSDGGLVEFHDLLLTQGNALDESDKGVLLLSGGVFEGERLAISGVREIGIIAIESGTTVDVSDLLVRAPRAPSIIS
ncbi:MAG: hypothetical protein KC561_11550, partial [Myxococcales bacterium]|nr:hypothetical protein [Myxococcales bacterium]